MKRILLLMLALVLLFSLAACQEETLDDADTGAASPLQETRSWVGTFEGAPASLTYDNGAYTLDYRQVMDQGNYEIYEKKYSSDQYLLIFFENGYFGSDYWDLALDNELDVSIRSHGRTSKYHFVKQQENLYAHTQGNSPFYLELNPTSGVASFYYQCSLKIRYTPSVSKQILWVNDNEPVCSLDDGKAYMWKSDGYGEWSKDEETGEYTLGYLNTDHFNEYKGTFTMNAGDFIQFGSEGPVFKSATESSYISEDGKIICTCVPSSESGDGEFRFYTLMTDESSDGLTLVQIDGGIEIKQNTWTLFSYSEKDGEVRMVIDGNTFAGKPQADHPAE